MLPLHWGKEEGLRPLFSIGSKESLGKSDLCPLEYVGDRGKVRLAPHEAHWQRLASLVAEYRAH